MTITVAWVRKNKDATEFLMASDSRLRNRGAMNQAQKLLRLERGDCCLGFAGDAQVAYPLFAQIASTLNNFIKTRTRATDVTTVVSTIGFILNNLIADWDLTNAEKAEELNDTRILFGGWSWKFNRFELGFFRFENDEFQYHRSATKLPHPWALNPRSFIFIGDYKIEYLNALNSLLQERHGIPAKYSKKSINFDYEPVEALARLLGQPGANEKFPSIGGAPQLIKIYQFGNDRPFVVRTKGKAHFLFGRRLFEWEKTEYPVIDLSEEPPQIIHPMSAIPLPVDLHPGTPVENDPDFTPLQMKEKKKKKAK